MTSAPRGDTPQETPLFRDGEILAGKYEIDRVLGQGGMGVVVAAHHIALRQKVAIKFLLPEAMRIEGAVQRFLREARSAVAIQSEHVARVIDVGTLDGGQPYLVMEYLTGSDLGDVLRKHGPLSVSDAVDYVLQACEAIAEAHAQGVIHRDLKPDNVFLTERADGSPLIKVLDFGLSKPVKDDGLGPSTPSLTGANMVAGSPQYMSPEQLRSLKNVDSRTDIWALGVILYELLVGRRPFDAETVAGVFATIAADPPVPPRAYRPELPPALEAVILTCLEKDVSRRVPSVGALARMLEPFAPSHARTSVERIVRISEGRRAASAGQSRDAAARPPMPAGDSLEADIPTMAAPAPPAPMPIADRRNAPTVGAPDGEGARAAPGSAQAAEPKRSAIASRPSGARGAAANEGAAAPRGAPAIDLDFGPPAGSAAWSAGPTSGPRSAPMHPAERGRVIGDPLEKAQRTRVSDLGIGGPLRVIAVAIVIAAADMIVARVLGQPFTLGPVRPLWLAAPVVLVGAVWLVARVAGK